MSVDELRKRDKENRRLKHELETEKEKFNQMVAKYQADLQNLQATLYEESQGRLKLSMELDTKESEVYTCNGLPLPIWADSLQNSYSGISHIWYADIENCLVKWICYTSSSGSFMWNFLMEDTLRKRFCPDWKDYCHLSVFMIWSLGNSFSYTVYVGWELADEDNPPQYWRRKY